MLVKELIYFLYLFIFAVSILNLIYSIKYKNKCASKYIIVLSAIFILYSIIISLILPDFLNLDIGLEILVFYGILFISGILFIISIIVVLEKEKKLNIVDKAIEYKIGFTFFVLFPIIMFCFSYFKEMNYINNSKLILVCSKGDGFNESHYAYAISDGYSEVVTIGANYRGYSMKKHLPSDFSKLNYTWLTDKIEINDNEIIIFRNDEIIYRMNSTSKISYCELEEVFYKK